MKSWIVFRILTLIGLLLTIIMIGWDIYYGDWAFLLFAIMCAGMTVTCYSFGKEAKHFNI